MYHFPSELTESILIFYFTFSFVSYIFFFQNKTLPKISWKLIDTKCTFNQYWFVDTWCKWCNFAYYLKKSFMTQTYISFLLWEPKITDKISVYCEGTTLLWTTWTASEMFLLLLKMSLPVFWIIAGLEYNAIICIITF